MGLGYSGVCRYWGTFINMYVAEPEPLKWTNKWVFNVWDSGLILGGREFFPPSISYRFPPNSPTTNTALVSHFWEHTMALGYFRDDILKAYATTNERPEIYTTGIIEQMESRILSLSFLWHQYMIIDYIATCIADDFHSPCCVYQCMTWEPNACAQQLNTND